MLVELLQKGSPWRLLATRPSILKGHQVFPINGTRTIVGVVSWGGSKQNITDFIE